MALYKMVDGVRVQLTETEEAEILAERAAHAAKAGERLMADVRSMRTRRLSDTDFLTQRHYEEQSQGRQTSLSAERFAAILAYRQALRDLPANTDDPANPAWPVFPG
ncbi:MAG: phage tail assembly chaperone [Alphaproteobacteria bacterium]